MGNSSVSRDNRRKLNSNCNYCKSKFAQSTKNSSIAYEPHNCLCRDCQNRGSFKTVDDLNKNCDNYCITCGNLSDLLKNNSTNCCEKSDINETAQCSYNDSKKLKINEDGLSDISSSNEEWKDNSDDSSSEEESKKLANKESTRFCRDITLTNSNRSRKLPKNQHRTTLYGKTFLKSLPVVNHATSSLQNESNHQVDEFECCKYNGNEKISEAPEEVLIQIALYLRNEDIINLLFTSSIFVNRFAVSKPILRLIDINVDKENYNKYFQYFSINFLPFINLSLDFENVSTVKDFLPILKLFGSSIENLKIENADFKTFNEFLEFFNDLPSLKKIELENCRIQKIGTEQLPSILNLCTISFNKCNDNIFKAFIDQKSLEKITIRNDHWTWSGFPHDKFNLMAKNAENLHQIVLIGSGTGSFFDSDQFLFNVRILDTTMISFHWYVGIRNGRINFLQTQKGFLKELTIHELPFDFDGGKVLKYIIEDMKLEKFYYGKIPLTLNGQKQHVERFEASEIQIQAIYEMFRQFPSITSFRLNINETDIASDAIERVINPQTNLFDKLQEFEVNDNSKYRSTFGVFLGLLKNFRNIRKLILRTQDRNINTLMGEFLPIMTQLTEIYLPSTAPRVTERFQLIKTFVPNLSTISVASQFFNEARETFGQNVNVIEILNH